MARKPRQLEMVIQAHQSQSKSPKNGALFLVAAGISRVSTRGQFR